MGLESPWQSLTGLDLAANGGSWSGSSHKAHATCLIIDIEIEALLVSLCEVRGGVDIVRAEAASGRLLNDKERKKMLG